MATTVNNTMVKIQTVTVGSGGASSIDFTSIPQTYTDLVIKTSARNTSTSTTMYLEFNGSGGTAYSVRLLYGDGSAAGSTSSSSRANIKNDGGADDSGYTASTFASSEIYIPNYTSSNYKSVSIDGVPENNATTTYMNMVAGLWSSTSAITSIKLTLYTGNFAQYSTATLYGVTATPNTTKASGGIIYQDATYMYHVFPYSSTFTPSSTLSCDILVVAGGGGGTYDRGAGGGAGGLSYLAGSSLSATGYTVTVGAGGAGTSSYVAGNNGSNSVFNSITSNGGGGGGAIAVVSHDGNAGGSGGGAGSGTAATGGASNQGNTGGATGYGYAGGNSNTTSGVSTSGGGGGAGGVGAPGANNLGGAGGVGSSSYSSWAIATNTGQIVSGTGYYAGGGGGSVDQGSGNKAGGAGGYGGGGAGGTNAGTVGTAGTANTGGGGGGGANNPSANGGNGGSGIVIIRYAK